MADSPCSMSAAAGAARWLLRWANRQLTATRGKCLRHLCLLWEGAVVVNPEIYMTRLFTNVRVSFVGDLLYWSQKLLLYES